MKKCITILLVLALALGNVNTTTEIPKSRTIDEQPNLGALIRTEEGNKKNTNLSYASDKEMLEDMVEACRNESMALYYNINNMTVCVQNLKTGELFMSNPCDANLDPNFVGDIAKNLSSQVVVTCLEENKKLINMWSSSDAAALGQYTANVYENALTFQMALGSVSTDTNSMLLFSKARYEELYAKVSGDIREYMDFNFTFLTAEEAKNEKIADKYSGFKYQDVYYCAVEPTERNNRKFSKGLSEAGYSYEQYIEDMAEMGTAPKSNKKPYVNLELQYILEDDKLTVRIPVESITYEEEFPLLGIKVLPYFGAEAPNEETNTGYLFIPDGSGAIIEFDNTILNRRSVISGRVYGEDNNIIKKNDAIADSLQYYLPVFGIVRNNQSALFAVISSSEEMADVVAQLGEPNGSYYTTFASFDYTSYERHTSTSKISGLGGVVDIYLYDSNHVNTDFQIDYYLLSGEEANYSGMAATYRQYLIEQGMDKSVTRSSININTLGSARADDEFLGFDCEIETAFTSYSQNQLLLQELMDEGLTNLSLTMSGWQNQGLNTSISNQIRISSVLGGQQELNNLLTWTNSNDVNVTMDNEIIFGREQGIFDGLSVRTQVIRNRLQEYVKYSVLDPATQKSLTESYYVSPSCYDDMLKNLMQGFNKYTDVRVDLGKMGMSLNSDFRRDKGINRTQTLTIITELLNQYHNNKALSFEGANAYVLPYATVLKNVPYECTGYVGETYSIPFVQLVVSGSLECNSEPINLMSNTKEQLLYCLQSGTVPTFVVAYDNVNSFKKTDFTQYYSLDFSILKEDIVEAYEFMEEAYSATEGGRLVSHTRISENVYYTVWENGTEIYVNINDESWTNGAVTVAPQSYFVIKGV